MKLRVFAAVALASQLVQQAQTIPLSQMSQDEIFAQTETEAEFLGEIGKFLKHLFGPSQGPPPDPMHEIGGIDVNLVSNNKSSTGNCNKGGDPMNNGSFLKNLPGMASGLKGMFAQKLAENAGEEDFGQVLTQV